MPTRSAGFTLVELVVAFVILSIGVIALLEAVGQSTRNARLARDRTQAALLAQQKMEELLAQPDLQPGDFDGDFGDRYPQFRWRAQVQPVSASPDQAAVPLYRVTVVVEWREGAQRQEVQLDTLWSPVPLTPPSPAPAGSGLGGLSPSAAPSAGGGPGALGGGQR